MDFKSKYKKILVIDDDHGAVRYLQEMLAKHGFEVWTSNDAAEGLQKAMNDSPDLIILDVMMPVINGYNFCKLLKTQEHKKHIPIIFITSRDDQDDVQIGLDMGAEAYLTKPVQIDELLKTIKVVESMNQKS